MRARVTRRQLVAGVLGAAPLALAGRPTWHVWRAYREDSELPPLPAPSGAQDASYLATGTSERVLLSGSSDEVESQLRAALARASKGVRRNEPTRDRGVTVVGDPD